MTGTIPEDEKGFEDDESRWSMTDSELLPKHRVKQPRPRGTQDSMRQSFNESSRLAEMLSNQNSAAITPSIRKVLVDRANFYRRKLTFYENLDVLATSMTSAEIKNKL